MRLNQRQSLIVKNMPSILRRIHSKTVWDGECVIWEGSTHDNGDPVIFVGKDGSSIVCATVSHVLYYYYHGRFPTRHEYIKITCGNNLCLAHTELDSRSNLGSEVNPGPLKPKQVREIRKRYKPYDRGRNSGRALAREFGTNRDTVSDIVNGKSYRWVR